jgi:hypothetical protein
MKDGWDGRVWLDWERSAEEVEQVVSALIIHSIIRRDTYTADRNEVGCT